MKKNLLFTLFILFSLISCTNTSETMKDVPVDTSSPSESTSDTENNTTKMSFFVTSKNPWNGANLWGVEWADAYCQSLAQSVGAGDATWRAYLSTSPMWMLAWINARDRIGTGPWYNANGVLIASNLEELHSSNNINKVTAITEKGETVMGRGDETNLHDILTGSNKDGTASWSLVDTTCANWTSSGPGSAIVGHHDRMGLNESDEAKSWNSSHSSRWCSMENLKSTGGVWLFYCFAVTWE